MILDALFVIWITWQVARSGRGLLGTRQRNHPTGFNLCVFECFWLRIANSNKTRLWLNFRLLLPLLLLFCFPAVSWAAAQKRPYISHIPARSLCRTLPCYCWWWCNFSLITKHLLFVPLEFNLRLLWRGGWRGMRGVGGLRASISVTACACWH